MDERQHDELMDSLVGHRIERAECWTDPKADWDEHNYYRLHLDDGRVVELHGWGYDAWGANAEEVELVNVAECRKCHKPHPESHVFKSEGNMGPRPKGTRYAYCTDGNSTSWKEGDPVG